MKELNNMCLNCINKECSGTSSTVWTGCIYKETDKQAAAHDLFLSFCKLEGESKEAAYYSDIENQITRLADEAETQRDFDKLEILREARDNMAHVIAYRFMLKHGYYMSNATGLTLWQKEA